MEKTIYKLFWIWDFDKEEKWLNEMASEGFVLVSVSFCRYTFEPCLPGEYNVRLELLEHFPGHIESIRYINFIEETNAQYIGSVKKWVYFKKKTDIGEFNLISDKQSRIKLLNRLLVSCIILAILEIMIGIMHFFLCLVEKDVYFGISSLCIIAFGVLILSGFFRIYRKKCKLEKEKQLFE